MAFEVTFALGGAASGKSVWAEKYTLAHSANPIYVATAQPFNSEMEEKIIAHKKRRDNRWETVEEPFEIAEILGSLSEQETILIDCVTIWLNNILISGKSEDNEITKLITAIRDFRGMLVLVSNEVGQGIVPDNKLARKFRETQGLLNQRIAQISNNVILVTAGLPLALKGGLGEFNFG